MVLICWCAQEAGAGGCDEALDGFRISTGHNYLVSKSGQE